MSEQPSTATALSNVPVDPPRDMPIGSAAVSPPAAAPDERLIGQIEKPPTATSDAASPAPEAPREPKAETVALATFQDFRSKRRREDDLIVNLDQEDGTIERRRVHGQSIKGPDYDDLISKCPPTREQQGRNMTYNPDTFEPLLLSEVITSPKLTPEQWVTLRSDDAWSGGEWATLVMFCQALCMRGLDVPFNKGA